MDVADARMEQRRSVGLLSSTMPEVDVSRPERLTRAHKRWPGEVLAVVPSDYAYIEGAASCRHQETSA